MRYSYTLFWVLYLSSAFSTSYAGWRRLLEDDFSSASEWQYEGATNAVAQPLFVVDTAAHHVIAEWNQTNYANYDGDPCVLIPSRLTRSLPRRLTDRDSFRFGATLTIEAGTVPDTTEFYPIANFGLYDPDQMGPDRAMDDNWSGNSNLLRDASDFVEFNYWINNNSWGWNPSITAVIGAHIDGVDGDYWTGSSYDSMWHGTDMGVSNWLPAETSLFVEVTYYGAESGTKARRARVGIFTDPTRTNLLTVNNVALYYWTVPLPADRTFSVSHVGFYNYVAQVWGGVPGRGRGSWADVYVDQGEGDFCQPAEANPLRVTFGAVLGEVYRLEVTEDLMSGVWTPLAVVTAMGDRVEFDLPGDVPFRSVRVNR